MNFAWTLSIGTTALLLLACSNVGGFSPAQYEGGSTTNVSTDKVIPTYPYAITWNSYVVDDGTQTWNGSGIGCSTSIKTEAIQCRHAGEQRKFTLPATVTSCAGLTAADALGAFDWTCDATGGTVTFYSTGLKSGKGLRDLIDGAGLSWRANALIVTGSYSIQSAPSMWWGNRVLALPNNSGTTDPVLDLDSSGAVYVATTSIASRGYNVATDQISVVTLGTSKVSFAGTAVANCNDADGSTVSPTKSILLCSGNRKFLWLEVNAGSDVETLDGVVFLFEAHFTRVLNTTLNGAGFTIGNSNAVRVNTTRVGDGYFTLSTVNGSVIQNLVVGNGAIALTGSTNNVISEAIASGGYNGVIAQTSSNNFFSRISIIGTESAGIEFSGGASPGNILSWITVLNSGHFGIANYSGTGNVFHGFASANSDTHGWNIGASSSISHAGIFAGQYHNIYVGSSNNKFSGNLVMGLSSTGDCSVDSGQTAPGLDSSCAGTDLSTGLTTYTGGLDVSASFKGKITVDDPVNASDTSGAAAAFPTATIKTFDWIAFLKTSFGPLELFRAWNADGSPFPNADHRSSWVHLGGGGRIWDLALKAGDTVLRNTTGDGATQNAPIVDGATCPPWLAGSRTITDASNTVTFLANAVEIVGDGVGNDDGLCESNERCIAAPNFGAYQGDGDYSQHRCTFVDGAVTGVTMFFYPTNGR